MFASGNVTIPVTDMNRAVHFYTETLGLKLAYRFGDHFASVQAGNTLTIGLHPGQPAAGSMTIGLELTTPIEEAVGNLEAKGVKFTSSMSQGKAGKFISFTDPDGNPLYMTELNRRHVDQGEGRYPGA